MDFEKDFFLFCYFFYCSRKLKGIGSAQTGARLKGCLGCVCGGVLRVFCGVFGQCLGAVFGGSVLGNFLLAVFWLP